MVHTREAWDDTFAVLDAEGVPERTVFHCFTGGPDEAEACLARGGHLSFSGIVSFPSADDVRAAAALCPLDRALVETDSPYLAPVPHRGRPEPPGAGPRGGRGPRRGHGPAGRGGRRRHLVQRGPGLRPRAVTLTPRQVRDLLAEHGLSPSRALGR
jgi:Tat protein secretion system quality control protein TatD with DNase activity